jgi:peptide deformylase
MKKPTILQKSSPKLREIALEVPLKDIKSEKIKDLIAQMKLAVTAEDDGVAIAAPQIGAGLRMFIVAGRAQALLKRKGKEDIDEKVYPDLIFINPVLTKLSKKKKKMEEGCLSVRWLYGEVLRSEKVTLHAYDENGKKITRGASGLLAQIFQHEVDHLNGILFIDKAENVEDLPPEKQNAKN